ncbi:membrane protein insertion efficiency factor YidD [Patescibacteria group bacterium]|nr:membrane protein insertion efficiency factor YidD [Patescibacteria group bacterium]MBU1915530.1 membrane protein insertion efficiency factor YidD [Patescibacteria group bacterium]
MIRVYKSTFSLDHGLLSRLFPQGYCRFWPSCSTYGYQAVEKYGIFKGIWLAGRRILRCNPWNKGGIDELK